jgi:hypothetical protein
MYNSVADATPKKNEAVSVGVKDAYITAYYNGERISLARAEELLKTYGPDILELNRIEAMKKGVSLNVIQKVDSTSSSIFTTPKTEEKQMVQLISTQKFNEFPTDVLNRYNAEGNFYYDEIDKRVKSFIYNEKGDLPSVYHFKRDIDTLYFNPSDVNEDTVYYTIIKANVFPGDVADWLQRLNIRKEIIQRENEFDVLFFEVSNEKHKQILREIAQFGLTLQIRTKTDNK